MTAYSIAHGEVVEVLRDFKDASFDALLCDPPYGFSFMGKAWDYDVPSVDLWRECLRVLKPGAPLVAFGGSRTYHRLACGIEDAGFELRDCLMWLYGKGFPKSQNIAIAIDKSAGAVREVVGTRTLTGNAALTTKEKGGTYGVQVGSVPAKEVNVTAASTPLAKAWYGYGTALKPAHEPIVLARKPIESTMVANVGRYGVGGLDIDGCRIGKHELTPEQRAAKSKHRTSPNTHGVHRGQGSPEEQALLIAQYVQETGRWPANLILDEEAAALLDASVAPTTSTPYPEHAAPGAVLPMNRRTAGGYADSGGPSRFFYCSKVSTKEREAGCEGLTLRSAGEVTGGREEGSEGLDNPRAGAGRTGGARNHHPTLKPLSLTTWLARLICPPNPGVILVPFAGAGSEMIGCLKAGWPAVFGIEREAEYVEIARARLAYWCKESEAA